MIGVAAEVSWVEDVDSVEAGVTGAIAKGKVEGAIVKIWAELEDPTDEVIVTNVLEGGFVLFSSLGLVSVLFLSSESESDSLLRLSLPELESRKSSS